jgi:O-antigen/teichoic acid export membrane protein
MPEDEHGEVSGISNQTGRDNGNLYPSLDRFTMPDAVPIDMQETWIIPVVSSKKWLAPAIENHITVIRRFIKNSGFYAIASLSVPLVSLILTPFLAHSLSPAEYGMLTVLNTIINLMVLITQLGMGSAFFRACELDYPSSEDRRYVLGMVTSILSLISLITMFGTQLAAPFLAQIFLGQSSRGSLLTLAALVILMQNLTIPGLSWLRRENHSLFYSLLSISNLMITLLATIVLVGRLHLGLTGALLATACGYASIVLYTFPIAVFHSTFKIRADIVWSLLTYGFPLIFGLIAYWILQLSDRYLLSLFSSFVETARYSVVYTLGSAVAVVALGPFTLAWPAASFSIARREDAAQIFKMVFRWFGLFLLFSAFGLSLVGRILLDWLFPVTYHSGANIIPIIAISIAFYGTYHVFMVGVNVTRKVWLFPALMAIAALINLTLNLLFIPLFGAMGAALSTLFAFMVLAVGAYIVNQRIYPVPYQVGMFIAATLLGVVLYIGSDFLRQGLEIYIAWAISFGALIVYGGCLALFGLGLPKLSLLARLKKVKRLINEYWRIA